VSARRKHIFLFVSNCLRKILGILVKWRWNAEKIVEFSRNIWVFQGSSSQFSIDLFNLMNDVDVEYCSSSSRHMWSQMWLHLVCFICLSIWLCLHESLEWGRASVCVEGEYDFTDACSKGE
jgi:hypothetical protein